MSDVYTGSESKPIGRLRLMLADTLAFQDWTGTTNTTDALGHVYFVEAENPTTPFAIIDTASYAPQIIALGTARKDGVLGILFVNSVSASHTDAQAARAFMNNTGAIMDDLIGKLSQSAALNITSISRPERPRRTTPEESEEVGDAYMVQYDISYWGA